MRRNVVGIKSVLGFGLLAFVALSFIFGGWGIITEGNSGVYKQMGTVSDTARLTGVYFKVPFISNVNEYVTRETSIDLVDLTPKAADNLALDDLDVTIFYSVNVLKTPNIQQKYSGTSVWSDAGWLPAYEVIRKKSRAVAYDAASTMNSLDIHKNRKPLANLIKDRLQVTLDKNDPDTFRITDVVIRSVVPDKSIDKAIRLAVAAKKELEAKELHVLIAKKDAEIEIAKAHGIAKANKIINKSLTNAYLQHELNDALKLFATNGKNSSIVIPANMKNMQLMLPTGNAVAR